MPLKIVVPKKKICCATSTHIILTTDRDFKEEAGEEKVQDGEARDLAVGGNEIGACAIQLESLAFKYQVWSPA